MSYTCDLFFFEDGTAITAATGPSNADGAVSVSCLTSGTPKFVIYPEGSPIDPPYASRTNTSGNFSGLVPGNYVINARTNDSCTKELKIVIDFIYTWVPRWRLQHGTEANSGILFRVDIEDNQFSGEVEYVTGTSDPSPAILSFVNEDLSNVFIPVIGSELVVNLISPTEGYFDVINSYDERRFRATYYVKEGGVYVQKWQGFAVPQNSDEEYFKSNNYTVSFTFSDGLQDLDHVPFSDDSGNAPQLRLSVMSAIVFCLKKTGLKLQIWETVNFYELGMDHGAGDSTLKQCYFDPQVYFDGTEMESCLSVLKSLMTNFAARLSQSNGVWAIDCPTLKTGSTTATRKFSYTGGSISGGNESYRIMLRSASAVSPKLLFKDRSARKTHQNMFGKLVFTFSYELEAKQNILLNGDFQDEDIENGQLKNWQIDYSDYSFPFTPAEIIKDTSLEHDKVLKQTFHLDKGLAVQEQIVISGTPIPLRLPDTQPTRLRLSFDTFTAPTIPDTYIYLDISLAMPDGTPIPLNMGMQSNNDGSYPFKEEVDTGLGSYKRVYIDNHSGWNTNLIETLKTVAFDVVGNIQVQIRVNNNPLYDYDSVVSLRTESDSALGKPYQNDRRKVLDPATGAIRQYKYTRTNDADDSDKIIRPFDYTLWAWQLEKIVWSPDASYESWLGYILLDNVQLQYLPNDESPPSEEVTEISLNINVKNQLPIIFRHGDLPSDRNYKNIMHGWFSDEDGVPTSAWKFRGIGVGGPLFGYSLIELLKIIYQGQYSTDRWVLQGTVMCLGAIPFLGMPVYEVRTGKIYILVSSSISGKRPEAIIQMIEALQGEPIIDEGPDPDPDVEPPVSTADFAAVDYDSTDFYTA